MGKYLRDGDGPAVGNIDRVTEKVRYTSARMAIGVLSRPV